jgi:hypothetical protein
MSSCRVQGCDKFERKRGLRGGTVADDCDYKRVDFCEKNRNAFRVSADSLGKNYRLNLPGSLTEEVHYGAPRIALVFFA